MVLLRTRRLPFRAPGLELIACHRPTARPKAVQVIRVFRDARAEPHRARCVTVRWHKEHDVPDNLVRSAHLSSLSEDDCASQNARHVTCHCIELGDEYPDCCPDGGAVLPRPGRWAVVATAYPSTSNDFVRPKLRQSLTRPTSYRLYHFYTTFIPLLYRSRIRLAAASLWMLGAQAPLGVMAAAAEAAVHRR